MYYVVEPEQPVTNGETSNQADDGQAEMGDARPDGQDSDSGPNRDQLLQGGQEYLGRGVQRRLEAVGRAFHEEMDRVLTFGGKQNSINIVPGIQLACKTIRHTEASFRAHALKVLRHAVDMLLAEVCKGMRH